MKQEQEERERREQEEEERRKLKEEQRKQREKEQQLRSQAFADAYKNATDAVETPLFSIIFLFFFLLLPLSRP